MEAARGGRGFPTPAERAVSAGVTAAANGVPYADNPHGADAPDERLAWSRGHNGARARLSLDRDALGLPQRPLVP